MLPDADVDDQEREDHVRPPPVHFSCQLHLQFLLAGVQRSIAGGAIVDALVLLLVVRVRARGFGALLPEDAELLWAELGTPFGVSLVDVGGRHGADLKQGSGSSGLEGSGKAGSEREWSHRDE